MAIDIGTKINPASDPVYPPTALAPNDSLVDLADSHRHSVQFYGDDAFLLDHLAGSIGSALGAGDAAIIIATKPHRDALARRLKARGLSLTVIVAQGRYIALDAAQTLSTFMRDGRPDPALFAGLVGGILTSATAAARGDHPRVAAFGEMVSLLWAEGKPEAAIRLEHLWNDLARTHSFDLHCAYPMALFERASDGEPLARVCAAHTGVVPAESYTSLAGEDERLRAIALLQQKAQALETEMVERKKAQESLFQSNLELREAIAVRDEFLSVAAHELKTPVTSLRGFAQLLLRDIRRNGETSPERLRVALSAIETQSDKLTHLVSRLLDATQIEAGKLRIEPVSTDLVALVRSVISHRDGSAHHTFVLNAPDRLEALVDPVRFEQVITNLLDNAVKFSPHGGLVTIALGRDEDGGARLSITDQGLGISPSKREAIFDRFHQAHDEHHLSGMGLGLYIAREIIELHGGQIHLQDPDPPGTRFTITLPPMP